LSLKNTLGVKNDDEAHINDPHEPAFDDDVKMQALEACESVKRRKRDRDVELIVKANSNPPIDTAVSEPEFDTTKAIHHGYR
jgi:hypothetical protein